MKKKRLLATLLLITCLLVSGCEKNTSEFLKDREALEKVETSDNTNDGKENQKDVTKGDTGNKETSKYANTPVPTDIPAPTNTPTPTEIPTPMNTPVPTNTPTLTPTNTPIAVSETDARAFEYTERRDDTIEILWLTSAGKKLTEIVIPKEINGFTVTRIGDSAFYGCDYLTSISIPNSITEIRDSAFSGCSGLTSISIPDSVTSIGDSAFNGCRGLTDINIPSSVTSIGKNAFFDCSGLTGIKVDANNPVYDSRNNCNAIIEKSSNKLILGCSNTVIPNNVASIGESAFCGCDRLTSISIPDSVTEIEDSAFRWCVCLTSVTLSNSLKRIEDELFCNCSCLTSISIPDSVTSIGWHAFSGCDSLSSIYVTKGSTAEQELRNLGYGDLLKYKD